MRKIATLLLALLTLGMSFTDAAAQSRYPGAYFGSGYDTNRYSDYRYEYRRPRHSEWPTYGRPRYYRRDNGALGAGMLALALGAIVAGAIANQGQAETFPTPPATRDPQLAAYCARRFRSFDPVSGTYLTEEGERLICTY